MAKGKDKQAHIGIFGRINTGKSSLINSLTGQDLAIVSSQAGTTTDPVKKSIEIPGIGPVVLIDTAGTADHTPLGEKRIQKTLFLIRTIDLAILVADREEQSPQPCLQSSLVLGPNFPGSHYPRKWPENSPVLSLAHLFAVSNMRPHPL